MMRSGRSDGTCGVSHSATNVIDDEALPHDRVGRDGRASFASAVRSRPLMRGGVGGARTERRRQLPVRLVGRGSLEFPTRPRLRCRVRMFGELRWSPIGDRHAAWRTVRVRRRGDGVGDPPLRGRGGGVGGMRVGTTARAICLGCTSREERMRSGAGWLRPRCGRRARASGLDCAHPDAAITTLLSSLLPLSGDEALLVRWFVQPTGARGTPRAGGRCRSPRNKRSAGVGVSRRTAGR